jgi:hypothetical protein
MKRRVTKISILQSSKIVTLLYVILGLVYVPFGIAMMIFASGELRYMGLIYIAMPILMAGFGFVAFVISAWLYNVLAKMVGGFEVFVEHIDAPPQPPEILS